MKEGPLKAKEKKDEWLISSLIKSLPYLHMYHDQHGRLRCYVRRAGSQNIAIPGRVGSTEFMDAYRAAVAAQRPKRPTRRRGLSGLVPGPHVYFLQAFVLQGPGPIKIGTTTQPKRRILAIQAASPIPLTLLAVVPGDIRLEREIHMRFCHLRKHNEWFGGDPELLSFIDQLKRESETSGAAMIAVRQRHRISQQAHGERHG